MAEGLIKFTYREGTKTPQVISEWLRAKPESMSYPEYLNVALIECLTGEDSAERVAQSVATGASASQAAGTASSSGVGVSASEIRSIVSDDGELTREAIRGLSTGVAEEVAETSGEVPNDILSTGDAEAIAKSLIEVVERDGEATRKAMESLSQTLAENTGLSNESDVGRSDTDLERIVTRLKDSILTDGQKTREMLSKMMKLLPSADESFEKNVSVTTTDADIELREVLRSDMLDMVTTIRQDSQAMRDDLSRVVSEAASSQIASFDEGTTQFFSNLHLVIANVLAKIDTMQTQVAQMQKVVSDSHDAIWEDMHQQEQVIKNSYDDVIATLNRIESSSTATSNSKDKDLLPEGISFAVPDDLFSNIDSDNVTGTTEASSEHSSKCDLSSDVAEISARNTSSEEENDTGSDFAGLAGMLAYDNTNTSEMGLTDFNPFGDIFSDNTTPEVDMSDKPISTEAKPANHPDSFDVPEVKPDSTATLSRMFSGGQLDSQPVEENNGQNHVDDVSIAPMTDPRDEFLYDKATSIPHTTTAIWSDDAEAPYGGLHAPDPEYANMHDTEKKEHGSLNAMLRSLLG